MLASISWLNGILAVCAIVSVLISAAATWFSLGAVKKQLWLQTFSEYTERYSSIVSDFPSAARDPRIDFDLGGLTPMESDRLWNAARRYFNLCSEEYYLHTRNRIDKETWAVWCRGIDTMMRLSWLRTVWAGVRDEYESFPGFCAFFDEHVEASTGPST